MEDVLKIWCFNRYCCCDKYKDKMNINILVTIMFVCSTGALAEKNLNLDAQNSRIGKFIEYSSQTLKELGYDPFRSEGNKNGIRYNFMFPGGINLYGYYENFLLTGISDILINNISDLEDVLVLDISLPKLKASVDYIYIELVLGNFYRKVEIGGWLIAYNFSLITNVPKLHDKLSINGLSVDVRVENFESHLTVKIGGDDYSSSVNEFIEQNLPSVLSYPFHIIYEEDPDFVVTQIIFKLINEFFNNSSF